MVTFKPSNDDDAWDSIPCGPYKREHALALADAVALETDSGIDALVEPMFPTLRTEDIQAAIQRNRNIAAAIENGEISDETDDEPSDDHGDDVEEAEEYELPQPEVVKAGIESTMRELLSALDEELSTPD